MDWNKNIRKGKTIMKLIKFLLSLWVISTASPIKGQCWNNINTQTTDWTKTNTTSNTWDWTQTQFNDFYITGQSNPVTLISPFWATGGGSTFHNMSLFDFQKSTLAVKKDFHPNDGWELLIKSFGTSGAANNAVSNPYFCLYNRFTGRVRAFLLVPDKTGDLTKTGAVLKVNFPSNKRKTALFQHMEPIGKVVGKFNPNLDIDVVNEYINEDYYWLFTEFTVAYDPCTCHDLGDPKESVIVFTYYLIEESKIDGKIEGTLSEKITQNQKPVSGDPVFALNGFDDVKRLFQTGQKAYKEYDGYKSQFNKFLNDHTDSAWRGKIWRSLQEIKETDKTFYDEVIQDLYPQLGSTDLTYQQYMSGTLQINPSAISALEKTDFLTRHYGTLKGIASFIPYVGVAIGVFDMLNSGGNSSTSQAVQGPVVFEANLTLDGNIKKLSAISAPGFYTPGFTTNSNTNFIPTYNNILGVFNVLELPDFEFSNILPSVTNHTADKLESYGLLDRRNNCEKNNSNFNNQDGADNVIFKQFRPKSALKYVVNPASNMVVESVEAAIIVKYLGKDELFIDRPSDFNNVPAIPFYPKIIMPDIKDTILKLGFSVDDVLISDPHPRFYFGGSPNISSGMYLNNGGKISQIGGSIVADVALIKDRTQSATIERIKNIESTTNLQLDIVSPKYPIGDSTFIQFRTDYLPVTCFQNLSLTLLGNNNIPKTYVKLYVRLKHKTDPNITPVTLILSYDIVDKLVNASNSNQTGNYDAKLWGVNWDYSTECCFKCGTNPTFTSAEISDYRYFGDFQVTSIPFQQDFFKSHNYTYSGEQNLTIIGDLTIPDNAIIPPNSFIKVGGKIVFGENITISNGTIVRSGTVINITKNIVIEPNVILEVENSNSLKYNCSNYNYTTSLMSDDEIISLCGSQDYKLRSTFSAPNLDKPVDSSNNSKINTEIYPNPNNGSFNIIFNSLYPESYNIEIYSLTGQKVYSEIYESLVGSNTKTINLTGLLDGVYLARLSSKDGFYSSNTKIVVVNN